MPSITKVKTYTFNSTINVCKGVKTYSRPLNLCKISLNRGLGILAQNNLLFKMSINEFRLITGQHPFFTFAKHSISTFKLRKDTLIGVAVTLRKNKMYSFLDRFIHLVLPQIFDFQGFSIKNFDKSGNYNFSLLDQSIFPEINSDNCLNMLGLNISFVFSHKNISQNISDLKMLGFPFQ